MLMSDYWHVTCYFYFYMFCAFKLVCCVMKSSKRRSVYEAKMYRTRYLLKNFCFLFSE